MLLSQPEYCHKTLLFGSAIPTSLLILLKSYNHILVPQHNLQQHNVPLLVALWLPTGMNMIIKVMTLNKSYNTVV